MTTITGKTYLPGSAERVKETCDFMTKHATTIIEVTTLLSPADVPAVTTFIAAIQAGCILMDRIHRLYDPAFGDTVSG